MNPDADVTYQAIYLVLTNVSSTSFLMFRITFDEISKTLSIQFWYKDRYTRYMWSNYMFILWNRISSIFYKDRECCLHIFPKHHFLFINRLIFDIMNTNQSLEF